MTLLEGKILGKRLRRVEVEVLGLVQAQHDVLQLKSTVVKEKRF